jgi:hypothetical protein
MAEILYGRGEGVDECVGWVVNSKVKSKNSKRELDGIHKQ